MKILLYAYFLIGISIYSNIACALHATDRIIVQFSNTIENKLSTYTNLNTDKIVERIASKSNTVLHYKQASSYGHVLQLNHTTPLTQVEEITRKLMQLDEIKYAEPDRKKYPAIKPNDPYYSLQWNLHSGPGGTGIENSWSQPNHNNPIIIAVIDTGITTHTDIRQHIIPGYDFISDLKTANDGDGRDADPSDPGDATKANECEDNRPEADTYSTWHGTIVAGLLVAESNNYIGISGILGFNPQAAVMPLRVLGKCGGYTSDIIDAARWASGLPVPGMPDNPQPAQIINLSLGGKGRCSQYEQQAINEIISNHSIIVASAGNENEDAYDYSPSGCDKVITVGASSRTDAKADYSNYGYAIDISAPGGSLDPANLNDHLFSTFNLGTTHPISGDAYAYVSGSSFAAPSVSGTIALMLDIDPTLTLEQIYGTLRGTARRFVSTNEHECANQRCGAGILSTDHAINAVRRKQTQHEALPLKQAHTMTTASSATPMQSSSSSGTQDRYGGGLVFWLGSLLVFRCYYLRHF